MAFLSGMATSRANLKFLNYIKQKNSAYTNLPACFLPVMHRALIPQTTSNSSTKVPSLEKNWIEYKEVAIFNAFF